MNLSSCRVCKWREPAAKGEQHGECRRNPPQVTFLILPIPPSVLNPQGGAGLQGPAGWPQVRDEQWCGEFQTKMELAS